MKFNLISLVLFLSFSASANETYDVRDFAGNLEISINSAKTISELKSALNL